VAEGDGPVNALDAALRKALRPFYPAIDAIKLDDYKVRIINGQEGTAAGHASSSTRPTGTSIGDSWCFDNIIEASWLALVDSFEYKLRKS
jgi:2-isopropylmalate synthase